MPGFDPNMLLQMLSRMQQGGGQMPQQPQGFGFGQPPQPYAPPQIDQTPGIYNQAARGRANMPYQPPDPSGTTPKATPAPDLNAQPSQASQWASQGVFGAQNTPNGQQAGLSQGAVMSLLKLFGL